MYKGAHSVAKTEILVKEGKMFRLGSFMLRRVYVIPVLLLAIAAFSAYLAIV